MTGNRSRCNGGHVGGLQGERRRPILFSQRLDVLNLPPFFFFRIDRLSRENYFACETGRFDKVLRKENSDTISSELLL
jgi:hypothetical protein